MIRKPELDADTVKTLAAYAREVNTIPDHGIRLVKILNICVQFAIAVQEVNLYREARGIEPLPIRLEER